MLPGTSYYDSWLLAMEALRLTCKEHRQVLPNYRRYRLLQIIHGYKGRYFDKNRSAADVRALRARMTPAEIVCYGLTLPVCFALLRLIPGGLGRQSVAILRRFIGQHAIQDDHASSVRYDNILDVYDSL
jgi:hypothetical protein